MKEIIFNKKDYESYKDFYRDIVIKFDAKNNIDFCDTEDLGCNADILNEFINYYEWGLIIKILNRFVEKYPNNELVFKDEE